MSELLNFLTENPVDDVTEEVAISPRFKDKNGKILKFEINAMRGGENDNYNRMAFVYKGKGKNKTAEFDTGKYHEQVVINHTLNPCFKNADAIKKAGCETPEQFLRKSLLDGEVSTLADAIVTLSGFGIDMDEIRDEAKNS